MILIGQKNKLQVSRKSDYGLYLTDDTEEKNEVLLPTRYVTPEMKIGDEVEVFVYTDSEDRPVATTETPYATVGEFAFLQVEDVNKVGAFLDWGLAGKNLLVPFSEQKIKMREGGIYLVYVYLDHVSQRVIASAKVEKFLGNVIPRYRKGQRVSALVIDHNPLGYHTIVDNLHRGMIYQNQTYSPLEVEQTVSAYVTAVRPDGKIDLTLTAPGAVNRAELLSRKILEAIKDGSLGLNEKSSPQQISERLYCSKRDFKRAIGTLYKQRLIEIDDNGLYFINQLSK